MRGRTSCADLRKEQARYVRQFGAPELRSKLGESIWLCSNKLALWQLFAGAAGVAIAMWLIYGVSPTFNGNRENWSLLDVTIAVGAAAVILYSWSGAVAQLRDRGMQVRLDRRGVAVRQFSITAINRPRYYAWTECGTFAVKRAFGPEDEASVVCRLNRPTSLFDKLRGAHRLRISRWFGDPADLVIILNAYRDAFGVPDSRP